LGSFTDIVFDLAVDPAAVVVKVGEHGVGGRKTGQLERLPTFSFKKVW
jgi:hypothetical protein